jgi:tetratricopeptide (TPR) repeat protein
MADSDRLDSKAPPAPIGTDGSRAALAAQIEALLLEGLDRYFAHRYDDAIHVWTRVLFLDRENARARAYIDRARSAVAERQRHGEELLQAAQELLESGEVDRARVSLQNAVAEGADDARAAALWLTLERRERARPRVSIAEAPAQLVAPVAPREVGSRLAKTVAILAGVAVAAVVVDVASRAWLPAGGASDLVVEKPDHQAPVVLSSTEVALVRARSLYARGRLAEALVALERVSLTTQNRAEVDALRRDIQRLLLATAQPRAGDPQGPHS